MSIGFGERGDEIPVEISIQVDETARGYGIAIDRGAEEKRRTEMEAGYRSKAKEVYGGFDTMSPEDQKVLLDVIYVETNPVAYNKNKLAEASLAQAAKKDNPEYDNFPPDEQKKLRDKAEDKQIAEYREFAAKWRVDHPNENPSLTNTAGGVEYTWQVDVRIKREWDDQQSKLPGYIQEEPFFKELQRQYLANREKLFSTYPDLEKPFKEKFDRGPISQ